MISLIPFSPGIASHPLPAPISMQWAIGESDQKTRFFMRCLLIHWDRMAVGSSARSASAEPVNGIARGGAPPAMQPVTPTEPSTKPPSPDVSANESWCRTLDPSKSLAARHAVRARQ